MRRPTGTPKKKAFPTTEWSLVVAAGNSQTHVSRRALETLCQRYWLPVYIFVRKRGSDREEAQDLAQGFFLQFLEQKSIKVADPERGRFRSFLLGSVKHFLANDWDRRQALKRGSGKSPLRLDLDIAEDQLRQTSEKMSPERVFERRWADIVLGQVLDRLREEEIKKVTAQQFEVLKSFLTDQDSEANYRHASHQLGRSEGAVKVKVHRMRRRFGALLRDQISQTVSDPQHVDDEIRYLLEALGD